MAHMYVSQTLLQNTTQSRRASSRESLNSFGKGFYGPKLQESTPISKQLLAKGQKKTACRITGREEKEFQSRMLIITGVIALSLLGLMLLSSLLVGLLTTIFLTFLDFVAF